VPHFFIEPAMREGNRVTITGPLQRHLAAALRLRVDETVYLVDAAERLDCQVMSVGRSELVAKIRNITPLVEPSYRITLAIGMPKGKKLEEVVKRAVELGVHRIRPVVTERSVARGKEGRNRGERLSAIALEAAQQSGRASVPLVDEPITFDCFASEAPDGLGIVLWEQESDNALLTRLQNRHTNCSNSGEHLTLLVGPEGGLAPGEVARLTDIGYLRAGLGPTILRTETACIAALAVATAVLS
jgi:16S rRNA (uracil1498-N3)-methyltransferase